MDFTNGAIGTYSTQYEDKSRPGNVRVEYYTPALLPHKVLSESVPMESIIKIDSPFKDVKGVQDSYVFIIEDAQGNAVFRDLIFGQIDKTIKNLKDENERLRKEIYRYKDIAKLAGQEKEKLLAEERAKHEPERPTAPRIFRPPFSRYNEFEDF